MLNVLDEKWKDHLYDLDQLRNAIHYRSWGQKDPLIEYKQEAYTMFVDLMNDIHNTFTERFLKVQITFEQPRPLPPMFLDDDDVGDGAEPTSRAVRDAGQAVQRARRSRGRLGGRGRRRAARRSTSVRPSRRSTERSRARKDPVTSVGGSARASDRSARRRARRPVDRRLVERRANDPCPCGSGKKFKKCHGATSVDPCAAGANGQDLRDEARCSS